MTIADNDIIAEMRRQPEQGFRLLMRKYREPVYWHIRRMVVTHADAQDAAQETFVRIFKSMDSYRGNTSFAAWIYRIATNEALRLISKRHDNVDMEREGTNLFDQMPADNYIKLLGHGGIAAAALHDIPQKHKAGATNQRYGEH